MPSMPFAHAVVLICLSGTPYNDCDAVTAVKAENAKVSPIECALHEKRPIDSRHYAKIVCLPEGRDS
jgi:hypothetical protein